MVMLVACSSGQGTQEASSGGSASNTSGGTGGAGESSAGGSSNSITILLGTEPGTLDPAFGNSPSEFIPIGNILEGLFTPGENLEITPVLAESYEIIDDLTWEFKLRQG